MRRFVVFFLLLVLLFIIFHSWFLLGVITSGDFLYFSKSMMNTAVSYPYAWGWNYVFDGFAKFISPYSWILPFINFPQVVFGRLGMNWAVIERISYLYPLLVLLIISPIVLFRTIFPKNKFYLISVLVFSFNTYSLLLAGGEIFLALAYFLIPLILVIFIKLAGSTGNRKFKNPYSITAGMLISLQIMLDPRVAYVTLSAVVLLGFAFLMVCFNRKNLREVNVEKIFSFLIFVVFIPGAIVLFLNTFWILPTIFYGANPVKSLGVDYSSIGAVKFLSFAKLENTISLIHPNWPENIFGKVYFMRSEFLFLPILAFASLFFVSKIKERKIKIYVIFFASLGLLGAFLSKGINEPFGVIYQWMFAYVPGFVMFRDPAKWYPLVAISYSVLIPFTIWKTYEWLKYQPKFQISNSKFQIKSKNKIFNFQNLFIILTTLYLILLIRPAILGQLGGMFKTTSVPQDYVKLEKFLANQPDYFRTLWVPSKQKFGYYSNNHPEMSAQVLFNVTDSENLFKKLSDKKTEKLLEEASIKYVIVPYDSQGEIFLKDRKYSEKKYQNTVDKVAKISWLKEVNCSIARLLNCSNQPFGKIKVFEIAGNKDHFWSPSTNLKISYKYVNPTDYRVKVENAKRGDVLVFSESYDKFWVAKNSGFKVYSSEFKGRFNSFILPKDGNYNLEIYYTPQDWVNIGLVVSVTALVIITIVLAYFLFRSLKR